MRSDHTTQSERCMRRETHHFAGCRLQRHSQLPVATGVFENVHRHLGYRKMAIAGELRNSSAPQGRIRAGSGR
jgi:hypothetical protein